MKKQKKFLSVTVASLLVIFSIFLSGNFIFTQTQAQTNPAINGLDKSAEKVKAYEDVIKDYQEGTFLQTKVGQIVGTVLSFVGVLFLILMIYAGILWMTAQGNEQQVAKAKTLLINGIIGLIIVFSAYAITSFIGAEVL